MSNTQNNTGKSTELSVKNKLELIGLNAIKPITDRGVDLAVFSSNKPSNKISLQVKGRGKIQSSKRYRWFQIRTTTKQRKESVNAGLEVSDSWKKKIDLCDFFVLVSERFNEYWVFPKEIVYEIIEINKIKYGNRQDNLDGRQAEMDLDIEVAGQVLTEKYLFYLDNYNLIKDSLK